jgi:hypothetical protein
LIYIIILALLSLYGTLKLCTKMNTNELKQYFCYYSIRALYDLLYHFVFYWFILWFLCFWAFMIRIVNIDEYKCIETILLLLVYSSFALFFYLLVSTNESTQKTQCYLEWYILFIYIIILAFFILYYTIILYTKLNANELIQYFCYYYIWVLYHFFVSFQQIKF